jgi:hypothetical protein
MRRREPRPLSKEAPKEQYRSLSLLSPYHVREAYRKAWEACKLEGDTPNAKAIQELVTAFKLLWKWRRRG